MIPCGWIGGSGGTSHPTVKGSGANCCGVLCGLFPKPLADLGEGDGLLVSPPGDLLPEGPAGHHRNGLPGPRLPRRSTRVQLPLRARHVIGWPHGVSGRFAPTSEGRVEIASRSFVVDENGKRTAVLLPIEEYERLLEDLEDLALIAQRRNESTESLATVAERLESKWQGEQSRLPESANKDLDALPTVAEPSRTSLDLPDAGNLPVARIPIA